MECSWGVQPVLGVFAFLETTYHKYEERVIAPCILLHSLLDNEAMLSTKAIPSNTTDGESSMLLREQQAQVDFCSRGKYSRMAIYPMSHEVEYSKLLLQHNRGGYVIGTPLSWLPEMVQPWTVTMVSKETANNTN